MLGRSHGPLQRVKFKGSEDAIRESQKYGIKQHKRRDEWHVSFETVAAHPSPNDVIVVIDDETKEPLPRYIHPSPKALKAGEAYTVTLCQTITGYRFVLYREAGFGNDPRTVFETEPVAGSKLIKWGYYDHCEHLKLTSGGRYGFEAHGIWLTNAELNSLDETEPVWVNGLPPHFPPK
jgi:hypothetical protein